MGSLDITHGNPIIRHKHTADPTVVVHGDTIYLYTGHDEAPVGTHQYVMKEWLCFSSRDLVNWTDHSALLRPTDFSWGKSNAYASKVIERDGRFYWYVAELFVKAHAFTMYNGEDTCCFICLFKPPTSRLRTS